MSDLFFECETDAEDASGEAANELLKAIGSTLSRAPEDRRYDLELSVKERTVDDLEGEDR